jgi:hypothetical protein
VTAKDPKNAPLPGYCVICDVELPYRPGPRARFCPVHNPKGARCSHGVSKVAPCAGCVRVGLAKKKIAATVGEPTEVRAFFRDLIAEVRSRRDLPREMRDDLIGELRGERTDWLADLRAEHRGR